MEPNQPMTIPRDGLSLGKWRLYMMSHLFWDSCEILVDVVHSLKIQKFDDKKWNGQQPLVKFLASEYPQLDMNDIVKAYNESTNSSKTHCGVCEFVINFRRSFPNVSIRIVTTKRSLDRDIGACVYGSLSKMRHASLLSILGAYETYVETDCKDIAQLITNGFTNLAKPVADESHNFFVPANCRIHLVDQEYMDGALESLSHWHHIESPNELYSIGLLWKPPTVKDGFKIVKPMEFIMPDEYTYTKELWRKYIPITRRRIEGVVVSGRQRGGSLLGIPTANLSITKGSVAGIMGVLCGMCKFLNSKDGDIYECVISIGFNPYFVEQSQTMEVHIFKKFGEDFYGAHLSVEIHKKIRPQTSFPSFAHLVKAIQLDCEVTRE